MLPALSLTRGGDPCQETANNAPRFRGITPYIWERSRFSTAPERRLRLMFHVEHEAQAAPIAILACAIYPSLGMHQPQGVASENVPKR